MNVTRYIKYLAVALLGLSLFGMAAAANNDGLDNILWKEDFSAFKAGDKPGMYHNGKGEILEENGKRFYRFPGGFMGGSAYYGSRYWRNYELRFQLRPQGEFVLYAVVKSEGWRDEVPYMWYYVPIEDNSVAPYAHGLPTDVEHKVPAQMIDPPLEVGKWYKMKIRVTGNRIQVYAAKDGNERRLWDHEVLPGGGGADFHGTGAFDMADIEVEELPEPSGVATNKKIYDCTWMATPQLSSPADWVKSPLLNDPRYKEARFHNYDEQAAADLVTDATVQRTTEAGNQPANPRETSFYMVYREDGWYIYIQSNEPDIVNGKPQDSQLEVFFSPGIGDEIPYNQFIVTLSTGAVEDYDWQTFNRHYRPLAGYLQSKTEVVPGGWGTTIFIPWELLYDRLPLNGDLWRFNVIRWAPSGATTWGGHVHETGRFNLVRWQPLTPDQRMAIQKYVLGKAWQQYQARASALTAWWNTEPATRDLTFYRTAVEPLIQQCNAQAATMTNLASLGPDATAKLFEQVPKWMEIQYTVDELRRDYLLKQMFPS